MPDPARRYYWDSNVFLSYINKIPERISAIEAMLDEAEQGKIEIVTSTVTITEVAFAATEKLGHALDAATEDALSALWEPPIRLIEFHRLVAEDARSLIRAAIEKGESLKPMDAIHLATAVRSRAAEVQTYDEQLRGRATTLGLLASEPTALQQRLDLPTT